jgi:hypothetical protein
MAMKKKQYCLMAGVTAVAIILANAYFSKYFPWQWNCSMWIVAIVIVLGFVVSAWFGCKNNKGHE